MSSTGLTGVFAYFARTVLHRAVQNGRPDILQYLLENGADANTKDSQGGTPLDLARRLCRGPHLPGDEAVLPLDEYKKCLRILEEYQSK